MQTGQQVALMGAGYYGLNGIGSQVSIILLKVYNIPAVMYGLEILRLTDRLQRFSTVPPKDAQMFPTPPKSYSASRTVQYLLTDSLPLEAIHHKKHPQPVCQHAV